MTDVLDRQMAYSDSVPPAPVSAKVTPEISMPARVILAVISATAGVMHFVMMPAHWGEWTVEGIGFAVAGWFGLLIALAVVIRPSRAVLTAGVLGNLVFIGLWVVSRISGFPMGPNNGHAETVGFVDLSAVALEAAFVIAALVLIARPGALRRGAEAFAIAGAVAVGVIALGTAALASPGARNHAARAHGASNAGAAGGEVHGHEGAAAMKAAASTDDKGLSLLSNGHHSEMVAEKPLTVEERALLSQQMAGSIEAARLFPTVAAIKAAGGWRAGPFSPGLGAHYIRTNGAAMNADGDVSIEDAMNPMAYIYDGTADDSRIAGFMYYSMSEKEPVGFAGSNDVWHFHTNTCLKRTPEGLDAPFGADGEVTTKLCESAGGFMMEQTQWMVHVWSVPGWESRDGLFSEVNPALSCSDGSYYQLPMKNWIDHPLNICKSAI